MYCTAMKSYIIDSADYKTCLQLLKFLSKEDLLRKLYKVILLNLIFYLVFFFLKKYSIIQISQVLKEKNKNKRAICALKLVKSYIVRIDESNLNNVVEEEEVKDDKKNLSSVSRSQFKRV